MTNTKLQKFLLAVFIVATLSLATVITILLARQSQIENGQIVNNRGILRIATDPENIAYTVYLNETKTDVVNKRIDNLDEGEYTVKIQAANYADWEKKIEIKRNIVTDIYVKLFPTSFFLTQVTNTNIDKAFLSKDGSYIYYVVTNTDFGTDKGIWRLPISQTGIIFTQNQNPVKIADLVEDVGTIVSGGNYIIEPSYDNSIILLKDLTNKSYYVLNAGEYNKNPFVSVNSIVNFIPDNVTWLNGSGNVLVTTAEIILDLNLSNNIITLMAYKPSESLVFDHNNNSIYVYDITDKQILNYSGQKLLPIDIKNIIFPDAAASIRLAPMNSDIIFLKTSDGSAYYLNLKKFYIKKIDGIDATFSIMEISNDGTAAIYCKTDKSCYAFTAKENIALNTIETRLTKIEGVNCETGFVRFSPQSTHIVYYDPIDKAIKTVEPDGSNVLTIIQENGLLPFANFNYSADYLYVLLSEGAAGMAKNNIYKVQLDVAK